MTAKRIAFLLIALVILAAFAALVVSAAGATEERTIEQRVSTLEARVMTLEACIGQSCTMPSDKTLVGLPTGISGQFTDVPPTGTLSPTASLPPVVTTSAPTTVPGTTPTAVGKQKCNQGVGNGPEGCDPGNSNHNQPSNDENPTNRGGKQVP